MTYYERLYWKCFNPDHVSKNVPESLGEKPMFDQLEELDFNIFEASEMNIFQTSSGHDGKDDYLHTFCIEDKNNETKALFRYLPYAAINQSSFHNVSPPLKSLHSSNKFFSISIDTCCAFANTSGKAHYDSYCLFVG